MEHKPAKDGKKQQQQQQQQQKMSVAEHNCLQGNLMENQNLMAQNKYSLDKSIMLYLF